MNAPMPPNYRGYAQHPQPAHRPQPPRRAAPGPGPMMPVPLQQQQQQQHPQPVPNPQLVARREAAERQEAALRRSRKPTDKNIPDGIEENVIGDAVSQYKSLRDVEHRLDAAMVRKRLDIQDSVNRTAKRFQTLRIWISNTAENQPWQRGDVQNASAIGGGRYKVKIEGRLLDDNSDPTVPDDSDEEENGNGGDTQQDADAMEEDTPQQKKQKKDSEPPRKRLSHFFKAVTVEFDTPQAAGIADLNPVKWTKPALPPNAVSLPASADFDSLEFSRNAEVNLNATISLTRDEAPERFQVSQQLSAILDVEEETRGNIVVGLWEYIKALELQENEEKRAIRCDERLRTLFNQDKVFFPAIPESTSIHTTPLQPIRLPYTIRLDPEFQNNPTPTIYDIRVAVEDPLRAKMLALTTSPEYPNMLRQISALDDQLALVIQALNHSKARHSFFTALSEDPVAFMKRWMGSQRRDLEVIMGEATRGGGEDASGPEFRRGGANSAWDTAVAKEAVRYMLSRPGRQ